MEEKITIRLDASMKREMGIAARRRGLDVAHYGREAWARQLGMDTYVDQLAEVERLSEERYKLLVDSVGKLNMRMQRIEALVIH
jgi:hypothetical protein